MFFGSFNAIIHALTVDRRSVAGSSGNDFARQLAERNAELNPSSSKKFRSTAAPKGTKLGVGYQDRTQLRTSSEENEKAVRVKALEEMVKLGQMDQSIFEKLRDEIVGGNAKDVHLVKGLDYKLLQRVRRGEDVLFDSRKSTPSQRQDLEGKEGPGPEIDVDEEFERLEEKEVQPMTKEERSKEGQMAPPPPVAGRKRTRDDILRELKASRAAAAEKAKQSSLGPKFVKLGDNRERSRIERDERGREVLITVDRDGKVKRKVKKMMVENAFNGHGLLMPDKDIKPLGMEVVPTVAPTVEDDGDIFEDAGIDYNPLGDIVDDGDSDDSTVFEADKAAEPSNLSPPSEPPEAEFESSAIPPSSTRKRNYFGNASEEETTNGPLPNPLADPTILAALKKASTINPIPSISANEEETARLARRKKMLELHDRDAEDMDLEFGSSRFEDQEDGEDRRVKLSAWDGDGGEDGGNGEGKAKRKRKRGAKKRKEDVNSAADVLKAMERRKAEGK